MGQEHVHGEPGWIAMGLPLGLAGDHARAGRYTSRLLFTAARRRWREARALLGSGLEGVEAGATGPH